MRAARSESEPYLEEWFTNGLGGMALRAVRAEEWSAVRYHFSGHFILSKVTTYLRTGHFCRGRCGLRLWHALHEPN